MDSVDIVGRNNCTSDQDCLVNGRKACDDDYKCHGVSWYEGRLDVDLKICSSIRLEPRSGGWRTIMKKYDGMYKCSQNFILGLKMF